MKRILTSLAFIGVVLAIGTVGYMLLEKWPVLDAMYMTVITLSTVGFGEIHDLSTAGRVFTLFIVAGGVMTVTLFLSSVGREIVEGEFKRLLWRQKVAKALEKMSGHFILCGYGRVGQAVMRCFRQAKTPFLVIENDESVARELELEGIHYILGDATVEDVLLQAGIKRAKGLVTALANDSDNVYVCLTTRSVCPEIRIVARASDDRAVKNLKQAGANRVISPNVLGGHQLAHAVLRPAVLDFISLATHRTTLDLQMEELSLTKPSQLIGKSLAESTLRSAYHVIVVAVQKPSGDMVYNPGSDYILEEGDTLVVLGPNASIQELVSRES